MLFFSHYIFYFIYLFIFIFFNFLLDYRFWGTWAEHARQLRRYTHGSVLCFSSPLHPHLEFLPRLSFPTSPSHWPSPFPPNRPQCLVLPFLCPCVLIFHHPPMRENMRCFIFCSCVSIYFFKLCLSPGAHVQNLQICYTCHGGLLFLSTSDLH